MQMSKRKYYIILRLYASDIRNVLTSDDFLLSKKQLWTQNRFIRCFSMYTTTNSKYSIGINMCTLQSLLLYIICVYFSQRTRIMKFKTWERNKY